MFSFFIKKPLAQRSPALPSLDDTFYPLIWQQQSFNSAQHFLLDILEHLTLNQTPETHDSNTYYIGANLRPYQKQFSQLLSQNQTYQGWINYTVFGRYVQRSFSAFYQQSEDVFNTDMPEILKHELMRHTQILPKGQMLLRGGKLPAATRRDKFLLATLNPFQAVDQAISQNCSASPKTKTILAETHTPFILNVIEVGSETVKAFAVKHNKRTSEGLRNEVLVLDFKRLCLDQEHPHNNNAQPELSYLIRHYTLY